MAKGGVIEKIGETPPCPVKPPIRQIFEGFLGNFPVNFGTFGNFPLIFNFNHDLQLDLA